ncbi:MAG: VWA domain-containing protein [Thermaurantiacus sp.]
MKEAAVAAAEQRWSDALAAARLLATLPFGIGGARVRARPGPARDAFMEALLGGLQAGTPVVRIPAGADVDRLVGGLDLAATLGAGRPLISTGLLARASGGVLVLPMAERLEPAAAALVATALERNEVADRLGRPHRAQFLLIALDEGEGEEAIAPVLAERLAVHLELEGLRPRPQLLQEPGCPVDREAGLAALADLSEALGIGSVRALVLALATARALADGAQLPLAEGDLALAARLVLVPRAWRWPDAEDQPDETPRPPQSPESSDAPGPEAADLAELLVEAARALLPPDLTVAEPKAGSRYAAGAGRGGGRAHAAPRRGRPVGVRAAVPRAGQRLALVETLKAAAPWQALRQREHPRPGRFQVRRQDMRVHRLKRPAQSTTIFLVDASGSAALARLGEAKGAVELLLARAYVRRDEVALVAFRGAAAELLLPPTRSLARARRALADLPGGGGTPIARALELAGDLALGCRARGRTPTLVLLSDCRANVARADGLDAMEDAEAAARALQLAGIASILIDTAPRPRAEGPRLARAMGARHVPLPRVEAERVVAAVANGQ